MMVSFISIECVASETERREIFGWLVCRLNIFGMRLKKFLCCISLEAFGRVYGWLVMITLVIDLASFIWIFTLFTYDRGKYGRWIFAFTKT